jgi:ribosome modulation factor
LVLLWADVVLLPAALVASFGDATYRSLSPLPIAIAQKREMIMANPNETAWAQGYKTGQNGKRESLCPYKKGGMFDAWMQGWQNGAKSRSAKQA